MHVFLDSDGLTNLETLISHVRNSDCLVVLLTDEVLRRPWCAVEVVVACKAESCQLMPVILDDATAKVSDFIARNPWTTFGSDAMALFTQYGITQADIEDAYQILAGVEPVVLQTTDMDAQEEGLQELLNRRQPSIILLCGCVC